MLTAVETDSAFSSRHSLTLCPALSSRSAMSGQLRLETIHLTRRDTDDFWTMKPKQFRQVCYAFIKRINDQVGAVQAWVLQNVCEDLGQGNPGIRILKERFACVIILLPYMRDERWLLIDKQVNQTSQHGRGVVDSQVSGLAEEVGQKIRLSHRLLQLVDNAAEQHSLALTGITLDP